MTVATILTFVVLTTVFAVVVAIAVQEQGTTRQWRSWFRAAVATGRWTQPHPAALCPPPRAFKTRFAPLPAPAPAGSLVHVTDAFAWLHDKFGGVVRDEFEDARNVRVTHRFPDGSPCRSELRDTRFLAAVERALARRFDARPHSTNGRSVYRISNPSGIAEPSNHWVSEKWHIDNFTNDGFKLIVYCDAVGEENGPFEYQDPPTFVPILPRNAPFALSRLNYVGPSAIVTGPAGTGILFKNSNVPHKGNYCRRGVRDVINFHFVTRGGAGRTRRQ